MEEILSRFRVIAAMGYAAAQNWKATENKAMVGCTPMYLPEEIVHAAGILPVVLQASDEPITVGQRFMPSFFCDFVRFSIDLVMKGRLDFLDGLIFRDTCLPMRAMWSTLRRNEGIRCLRFVQLPSDTRRAGALFATMQELEHLKVTLQQFTGGVIEDESLRQSILIYNRNRALLRELYDLRAKSWLLGANDVSAAVKSSMLMPKEEHNELLQKLIRELKNRGIVSNNRVRLFLSGQLCYAPKVEILDLIEDSDAVVVGDDLYTGYRYFAADVETNKNPIEALAERYLSLYPCATRLDSQNRWGEHLVEMVKRCKAQGVITLRVKDCEPHMLCYPGVEAILSRAGIPHLLLETEHHMMPLEGLRARVEAFIEMIRWRLVEPEQR